MPLGTLDRSPPPIFKQGPSALSKLVFFGALAFLLMVADARFHMTQPVRALGTTLLYPLQMAVREPVRLVQNALGYFEVQHVTQQRAEDAQLRLIQQSMRAAQVEQLSQENARLRKPLGLRDQLSTQTQAAQVLYEAADPYTHRVVIDQGQAAGVLPGSPVLDEDGVLGQVTRVLPLVSEVTLVVDRDQSISVANVRTGARSVAFGSGAPGQGGLELRFIDTHADVKEGDLLVTSGMDGVFPGGLPVAKVERIERRADSTFPRIWCTPVARTNAAAHVMLVKPITEQQPHRPEPEPQTVAKRKGTGKGDSTKPASPSTGAKP